MTANQVPTSPVCKPKLRMKNVGFHWVIPYPKKDITDQHIRRCRNVVLAQRAIQDSFRLGVSDSRSCCAETELEVELSAAGELGFPRRGSLSVNQASAARTRPGRPNSAKVIRQP